MWRKETKIFKIEYLYLRYYLKKKHFKIRIMKYDLIVIGTGP